MKNNMWVFRFLFVLALSAAASAQTSSNCPPNKTCPQIQNMPANIRGVVRDAQTRQPLPYVRVVLEAERGGGYVSEQNTDTQGRFAFLQLGHAAYLVRIKMPGFKGTSQTSSACERYGCRRVDLTLQARDYVEFDLERLPTEGQTAANLPPGGAGATLDARDAAVPEAARKEFEKAKELADSGKGAESIDHFKRAIELYPQYGPAFFGLGMAYMDQKDWKQAEAPLAKATELNPNSPGAFLALGTVYAQEKSFSAAEKPLARGLELNPEIAEGQCELARTYLALNRWQDADPHAQKCAALRPDMAPAHVYLGNIALKRRDHAGALREFREYLRLDPQGLYSSDARNVVGRLEKELGPWAESK